MGQGVLGNNTVTDLKLPSLAKAPKIHQPVALTKKQLQDLISALPTSARPIFILASWCSLRYGEVVALNKADIDTTDWTVTINKSLKRGVGGR